MSRTHHLEIWSLYVCVCVCVCKTLFIFLRITAIGNATACSLVPKHPPFRKPSACLQGRRAAVHPAEEGSMLFPKGCTYLANSRSHIERQYERAAGTCKWRLGTKNWPLPQLGRAHNTRYFRFSSVWIFQSILSFSRVKQYGRSLVIQSSIF